MEKASLRREAIAARDRLSPELRDRWSAAIRERLVSLACWSHAEVIGLYAAIRGEVGLLPLIEMARASAKRVVFPRVNQAERMLEFFEIESASELAPGAFGVPEPPDNRSRHVVAAEIELLLVPGLAFDPGGRRLGFGGGFYDRLLDANALATIGLAFDFQIRPVLPEAPHDRGVEMVLTEKRAFKAPP